MLPLVASALAMSTPSPLTARRDYEVYLRGPVGAITQRFGTVDKYRHGGAHASGLMAEFPAPSDAFLDGNGILESGQVSVTIDAPKDDAAARAAFYALGDTLRNVTMELELVTRAYREDLSAVEITNERRVVVKKTTRRRDQLSLDCVDVDRSALDKLFPSETYTVEDWPELFVDHVNRPVAQAVGTVTKIPLTYLTKSGGTWKYGVAKVLGEACAVLTVYRDGRVVSPSEYSVATQAAAVSAYSVTIITFTKEQADQQGRLYALDADVVGPGSRLPADEVKRVLTAYGVSIDATSFADEALYHNQEAIRGDYGYAGQRTGNAILEDLLFLARGQLYTKPDGSYALFVDRPRTAAAQFDGEGDQVAVAEYVKPEIRKTVTLQYRPTTSQREDYAGKLQRTTAGVSGELLARCPFVRDHDVADRHMSYLAKREANRGLAKATLYGVQFQAGELAAIRSPIHWNGGRLFAMPQVSRPPDANEVTLDEYSADTYAYTPGTLPDGATNDYLPDYSQTPPAAPTPPAVISQGTSVDNDGKVTAYALIRAVPPAVNWARLQALVTDTTTNEIYQAQLILAAGNYEATVSGLRPNRAHTVRAWAVNADNVDGLSTAAVNFTSANYTTAPAAPSGLALAQGTGKNLRVSCIAVTIANFKELAWFRKVGAGGSFTEFRRGDNNFIVDENVSYGTTYYYKARTVDRSGNESSDSSEVNGTPVTNIGDTDIPTGGINGPTIGNGSINRGRGYTGTGSASGTINAGASAKFALDTYSFMPHIATDAGADKFFLKAYDSPLASDDTARFALENQGATDQYDIRWRNFLT